MNGNLLAGVIPAAITPLDEHGRFAPRAFEALLDRLHSAGSAGVYVCGQTGEGLLQPVAQRKQVAEVAMRCSPRGSRVIVHIGAHTTEDAIELARHASSLGATAISSLPPAGAYPFADVRAHYEAIAAVSDVPLLVYFLPRSFPSVSTGDQILELCSIPNVVGLKFTDFDLYTLGLVKRQRNPVIFSGRDEVFAAALLMGADGGIGTFYNLVPEWFVDVYRHAREGRWEQARQAQERINELISIVLRFPMFPAVKRILTWSGIDAGPCIRPRGGLTPAAEEQLRAALAASAAGQVLGGSR